MDARDTIQKKRDDGRLTPEEWEAFVRAYTAGDVTDYQMSAFLMACFIRGLDRRETAALTNAMLDSGGRLDLSHLGRARIDKHSIGGVGDKVSLVLAPLISALGVAVPMMSGRGLGHTGGTLDKLEAIPGFRTGLSMAEARAQMESLGCVLIGQTEEIAPADRRMYALRDATATVESIPLIASSIMSKKLAEGLTGLVLDVKRGSGAFLPALDDTLELAKTMVSLGADHGCPVVALVTAMDRPLGRACGNALETEEAIHALMGEGPDDLMQVTYALGAEMLLLAGAAANVADAKGQMQRAIADGRAAEQFKRIIEAQGGNPAVVDDPALLPEAPAHQVVTASRDGVIAAVRARAIGRGVVELGGGRMKMSDTVDPSVGFVITVNPGDRVQAGEPVATVFARDARGIEAGQACVAGAVVIADTAEAPLPLVSHRVSAAGVELYPPS